MASRRADGRRYASRFVDSSDIAFMTAEHLDDIDFAGVVTKFEDFEKAKGYLAQDLETHKNFRQLWEAAIRTFGRKPVSKEDLMKVSIKAYTYEDKRRIEKREKQLYTILNEQSRKIGKSPESWKLFPYKGWYSILAHSFYELPTSPENILEGAPIKCYRGVDKIFANRPGEFLVFNCFTSTSRDKEMAMEFKDERGTLFQFDYIPYNSLGIRKYSKFPEEEEVLLAPWSTFQIGEVKKVTDDNGSYTLVTLISKQ